MDQYFPEDSYATPDDVPRYFLDRLFFGSRWGLYFHLLGAVLEARHAALSGVYGDSQWARSSYRVMHSIERCGGKFFVDGFHRLRNLKSPVVFVANHMSTLETQVLPVLIAPIVKVTFVVKEKLVKGPLFGPIMRSRDPIVVERKHPGEDLKKVLTEGTDRLARGISVIVFPQSTRILDFDPTRFNSLGAKLAARAGVDVVPVALKTDFWENGKLLRGFGPVRRKRTILFSFGERIAISEGAKNVHKKTVDFIQRRLEAWQ